jgi:RHH-type proline utilization regulon transcriptional repressor/proline dehydrogenase/delta 1-pyrroline-5-carboxylate dehydrogenase
LYGAARVNSRGIDLADEAQLAALSARQSAGPRWDAGPLLASAAQPCEAQDVLNPADSSDIVGSVCEASASDVQAAVAAAVDAAPAWAATPPGERAAMLERAADAIEADTEALIGLLQREAGKTAANAVAEVREAVDFLRYDAEQLRRGFDNTTHQPLGPVVCISPWNFPLAIFVGQVAAALAAGNSVLAKPAEQTPLVAATAVRALHAAGVPRAALQLLPGRGDTVGAGLVGDPRVMGVVFTGSTEVARLLQKALATRTDAQGAPVPLVAETGGQNAMVVDSSALAEQVVADVLASAFDSAGQRCSALRVLCLQDDVAERVLEMLQGAMRELAVGDPRLLATDVGPVIDREAQANIRRHIAAMQANGRTVTQPAAADDSRGTFVAPTLIEIDGLDELEREVFGPVLHLLRYDRDDLDGLIAQINATGYGLTFGVHTRIDETVARVATHVNAGNVYVNRNMVGAVVGVQPFGGEGLSGTGPKAGGPLYLMRLLRDKPADAARKAVLGSGVAATPPVRGLGLAAVDDAALIALQGWARAQGETALAEFAQRLVARSPCVGWRQLSGPTGEANLYAVLPRDAVLCLAEDDAALLRQLAAVLVVGSRAVWPATGPQALHARLPEAVRERISLAQDWRAAGVHFDAALHTGNAESLQALRSALAERPGPIVGVTVVRKDRDPPLERLVNERSLSINTAAAGGNASLMTIG